MICKKAKPNKHIDTIKIKQRWISALNIRGRKVKMRIEVHKPDRGLHLIPSVKKYKTSNVSAKPASYSKISLMGDKQLNDKPFVYDVLI